MIQQLLDALHAEWLEHWLAWAVFGIYLAATWLVAAIAKYLMRVVIPRVAARSTTTLDDQLLDAISGPVRFVIWAVGLRVSLEVLGNAITTMGETVYFEWVEKLAAALVVLAFTSLVNGVLRSMLDWYIHHMAARTNSNWDNELLPIMRRILSLVVYFIGLSIILKNFNQDITALVTTAGVASLAVALAAQETLSNMLGGFTILVDRPFKVGDVIELSDGRSGEVIDIGLRSTRVRQFDGTALIIPNKDMANTRIINYAQPNNKVAIRQTIGVDYATDIEQAKQVLLDVLKGHPEILADPAPGVWFTKFGASSLDVFMSAWVDSYRDRFRIADELNLAILKAFREHGISIPFPQQDVHLKLETSALQQAAATYAREERGNSAPKRED